MKRKSFIFALIAVLMMFSVQSCLFEQEDIFEKSSSARLAEAMQNAQNALTAPEYGWVMEYFPSPKQTYGGYVITMKFTQTEVEVRSQEKGPSVCVKSYYKMSNENGPLLVFDTYNELIHSFSTPSATAYQAKEGEFEFAVMNVEPDLITLRGTRSGNIIYLYKLQENAESYLTKVASMENDFTVVALKFKIGEDDVRIDVDTDKKQVSYTDASGAVQTIAFVLTPDGFSLYKPLKVADNEFKKFEMDPDGKHINATGGSSTPVKMEIAFPEGYRPYAAFAGKYTLVWGKTSQYSQTVELVANPDDNTYRMTGLNDNYYLILTYNKGKGALQLSSQLLCLNDDFIMEGSDFVAIVNYDRAAGYVNYSQDVGMITKWNNDEEHPVYQLVDNGVWGTRTCSSFSYYYFTGTVLSTTTRKTSPRPSSKYFPGSATNYYLEYLQTLTKIAD